MLRIKIFALVLFDMLVAGVIMKNYIMPVDVFIG